MHKSPLLISGIGRSGTSAVISAMSKHKSVVEPSRVGEAPFFNHFIRFLIDYEDESPHKEYHHKNYQLDKAGRDQVFSRLLSQVQYGFDVEECDQGKEFWIAKVSLNNSSYAKCCEMFESLRIIYVIRNGVEVVNSAKSFSGFKELSFEQLCRRWVGNIEDCRYVHSAANCAVIKHNELVQDPHSVFENVFDSLRMERDTGPAEFISSTLFNSSFNESGSMESARLVFKDRLACWEEWSEAEKETFIRICDPHMQEFDFRRPYSNISSSVTSSQAHAEDLPSNSINFTKKDLLDLVEGRMTIPQFDYHANTSISRGYLFMENPKVASTSTLKVLQQMEDPVKADRMANPHARNDSPIPRFSSLSSEYKRRMLESDDIYRFTFVRDPYTRLLSAYLSKIARPLRPKAEILAVIHDKPREEVTDLDQYVSFGDFVKVVCSQETIDMNNHWKPQVDQILFDKIKYDFIGKFESLDDDFAKIVHRLSGDQYGQLEQSKNKTGSNSKLAEYYSPAIEAMVFERYEADFNAFDYKRYLFGSLAA
ncbi:sulfotransferase family 2 domain-containing protein [Granulosicoccus sp. 3-233]|uniref:sulfotransferase family 2 domain-containing protein n=1 Tax=Granulosicoccus sp. 3-233 TaxID=3417969 RepID=UPI003D333A25